MGSSEKVVHQYKKHILVTGGCGFIGSHMVLHLVKNYPDYFIVNLDKLDYCASTKVISEVANFPNYEFVKGDILEADLVTLLLKKYQIDNVLHFAAQTHVDNSFGNSLTFTVNNILGTHTLLECCKQYNRLDKFVHVSTDEVYGEAAFSMVRAVESLTKLAPTNPYAATKAGAEHIVLSYYRSWQFPVILTRSNNIYGPHQYPEKVIPKWICLLERNKPIPVHGDGTHKRSYIYVDDVVAAYDIILHKGVVGEVYNISSSVELSNFELAQVLLRLYGHSDDSEWINFVEDRAFNDHRYHIDGSKVDELGWSQKTSFTQGLEKTIKWYSSQDITEVWGRLAEVNALQPHPIEFRTEIFGKSML